MRALKRGPVFSSRAVRLAVAAVLSGMALAAAWWSLHQNPDERHARTASVLTRRADPLTEALVHCQTLGEAGARDQGCLDAWAENRRRFLRAAGRPPAPTKTSGFAPAASIEDR